MRKVDDGEEKEKRKRNKIMTFIVATNVIASRPPKRRPTGTPHARAKKKHVGKDIRPTCLLYMGDPYLGNFLLLALIKKGV